MADLPGDCRTHRLSVLLLKGDWADGEREAAVACAETEAFDLTHLALARALQGEILLRRGDLDAAESELTEAQRMGASPYPALALVRLARGDGRSAAKMIGDAAAEVAHDPLPHARLLPALVEISLANGDTAAAGTAATALSATASSFGTSALHAVARHAEGLVQLAIDEPGRAVRTFRAAWRLWNQVGSPYNAAIARMALAKALSASGRDRDAAVEAGAAREALAALGATLDMRAADDFLAQQA